jgi:hypothetical protein
MLKFVDAPLCQEPKVTPKPSDFKAKSKTQTHLKSVKPLSLVPKPKVNVWEEGTEENVAKPGAIICCHDNLWAKPYKSGDRPIGMRMCYALVLGQQDTEFGKIVSVRYLGEKLNDSGFHSVRNLLRNNVKVQSC